MSSVFFHGRGAGGLGVVAVRDQARVRRTDHIVIAGQPVDSAGGVDRAGDDADRPAAAGAQHWNAAAYKARLWQSIPALTVTTGHIELGIYSDANANNWIRADDFSLTRS